MAAEPVAATVPRHRRLTVSCPHCDVTWRGTLLDACWACGRPDVAQEAPLPQVKVVSAS
ncbi:MAG: hypothetical protein KDB21_15520 [Acidimicrobiales bacterium]|nr:hypothetical protein [Acidimicrobiales bacterium]